MEKISRLEEQQRSNLVAYLDGELSERECQEIEHVLARSEVARHEVDILSRAYDALDMLPPVRASDEFTRKTVSALRIAVAPRVTVPKLHWTPTASRLAMYAGWGAAVVLWACCGFLFTKNWIPNDSDKLLRDFPIAEKLDAFREAGSLEFLLELQRQGTFNDSTPAGVPSSQLNLPDRRKRIANTSESERTRLVTKLAEFERLPESERSQIRQLEAALVKEDDAMEGKLRQIMDDYQAWLATQTEARRTELEHSADPAVRARKVSSLRKPAAAADRFTMPDGRTLEFLTSSDLKSVMDALEKFARAQLEPRQLAPLDRTEGLEHFAQLLILLKTSSELTYSFREEKNLFKEMARAVSNPAQREHLQTKQEPWVFEEVIRNSILEEHAQGKPDPQALEDLFNTLDPDERDRVMGDETITQLETLARIYKERHPELYLSNAAYRLLKGGQPKGTWPGPNGGRFRKEGRLMVPQPDRSGSDRSSPDRALPRDGGIMKRRGEEPSRRN